MEYWNSLTTQGKDRIEEIAVFIKTELTDRGLPTDMVGIDIFLDTATELMKKQANDSTLIPYDVYDMDDFEMGSMNRDLTKPFVPFLLTPVPVKEMERPHETWTDIDLVHWLTEQANGERPEINFSLNIITTDIRGIHFETEIDSGDLTDAFFEMATNVFDYFHPENRG